MMNTALGETEKITVYFYSSETNINNFKLLKMEFDNYLSGFGDYEFQPFKEKEMFENHIKDKKRCLILLSSWHYRNIYKTYSIRPFLVGVRDGDIYQKRILVTSSGTGNSVTLEEAKKNKIASASSIQHTRSVLAEIFGEKGAAESADILTVPKDIDALMSVSFGMSRSALTTENSLEKLKTINPALYKNIIPLAEGKKELLPVLAVPEGFANDSDKIIKIIENMQTDPKDKKSDSYSFYSFLLFFLLFYPQGRRRKF